MTNSELRKKIEKILDDHFPDEMDSQMKHPNLYDATNKLLELFKEEVND